MGWLTHRNRDHARSYIRNSMKQNASKQCRLRVGSDPAKTAVAPLAVRFPPFVPFQTQNLTKRDNSMSASDMRLKAD
jgi:hypothetical protein